MEERSLDWEDEVGRLKAGSLRGGGGKPALTARDSW